MKNWLPFVFGPLFAIDSIPLALCCKRNSNTGKVQAIRHKLLLDIAKLYHLVFIKYAWKTLYADQAYYRKLRLRN